MVFTNYDLYFYEELSRECDQETAVQWLLSESKKKLRTRSFVLSEISSQSKSVNTKGTDDKGN
jgi:hypothetical protein